ncbi:family 20 glycosylhydrolase [Streptomyces sp. So13.3]|uniref:beta-N-acetylhexosaminidase n=1 Tax=Streptomyces TaxID=1883 RepID=UPI00110712D9|nr:MULTISPECIES: glycoside hydrolase family 20 protein [Streptomyces]MCZ4099615.1 glycoside hydrolase family 20 protein [Streptomyces sp. H39-C1]QNA74935.1 family 20 glycosylhydrolase [Streptomyces sp. So13.3]
MGKIWTGLALSLAVLTPAVGTPNEAPATRTLPVIPSVRDFRPAGSGVFHLGPGTRVRAGRGSAVEDEARLLAGQLQVPFGFDDDRSDGDGPAGTGDITLRIDGPGAGTTKNAANVNESYVLTARNGQVTIDAPTDAGAFYGTRTLLQTLRAGTGLPEGVIKDAPDRPQRGLLLDIARKPFARDWIEDRIRQLGDLKLNQLHLHFSDDQGFRIESSSHPEIVSRDHLSKADLRAIIDLAAQRHVTVIPEIDSPGHLGAVIRAHPDLQLVNASGRALPGAIDISKAASARMVDDLTREFAPLFPGPYWHLGGDEYQALVVSDPESSYPQLVPPGGTVAEATTRWLNDREAVAKKFGKRTKAWNDGFLSTPRAVPDRDREVEYWTGKELGAREPEEYLKAGRKVVNLNDEYLYYVLGEPNDFTYPTGERIYKEWTPAVLRGASPVAASLATPDRVLGGRFAVWCDQADAQSQDEVARGIRLPLNALAQKLWYPGTPPLSWPAFTALADKVG